MPSRDDARILTPEEKTCSTCAGVKPITEFFRHSHYPDGYRAQCKDCHKKKVERLAGQTRPRGLCACGCGKEIFLLDPRGRPRVSAAGHEKENMKDRFWRQVEKTETCWLWKGTCSGGYGSFSMPPTSRHKGHIRRTHKVSWEWENGPIPEGKQINHHCDVKNCVRPEHLYLGTHTDNMRDAFARGQLVRPKGEANLNAKLTEEAVRMIRASSSTGTAMAQKFGVSQSAISAVRAGKTWCHV